MKTLHSILPYERVVLCKIHQRNGLLTYRNCFLQFFQVKSLSFGGKVMACTEITLLAELFNEFRHRQYEVRKLRVVVMAPLLESYGSSGSISSVSRTDLR